MFLPHKPGPTKDVELKLYLSQQEMEHNQNETQAAWT